MKKLLPLPFFLILVVLYFIEPVNLKSNSLKKANQYYEKYDYHYAIEIYERLMQKKPTLEVAQKLANCYKFINNTEAAETAYAKVLTFPGFDPINYVYYAEALKQNGKFEDAKYNYLLYGDRVTEKKDYALKQANGCDVARIWLKNPDKNIEIENASVFNTDKADFSPVIYKEGILFISDRLFTQGKEKDAKIYGWTGNQYLKIYQVEHLGAGEPNLSLMPPQINDQYHNGPATITNDGKTLFFTKAGLGSGVKSKKLKAGTVIRKTIYYSEKTNNGWTEAKPFEYNNMNEYSVQHPSLSADGNILYFASDMPGGFGGMDLYYSEKINGKWTIPTNCGNTINTSEDEVFPYLRDDGKLYFSSRGHITIGGLDIFSSEGAKNKWTDPVNLKTPINSPKDDFGITFFSDNKSGYISSNRGGGKGSDDIYRFSIPEPKELLLTLRGEAIDKKTGLPLAGMDIYLVNKNTGEMKLTESSKDGIFRFALDEDSDYIIRGDINQLFSRQEGEISTKGVTEPTIFNIRFEVERGEEAYLVRLNNIHYDFDKYEIRQDAEEELSRVAAFLEQTPNVKIELRAHTDVRGTEKYNQILSEKRAISAKEFLINNGIDSERLATIGFGKTQLLKLCNNSNECTEEEHQLNRRTEFKVVKVEPMLSYTPPPLIKR